MSAKKAIITGALVVAGAMGTSASAVPPYKYWVTAAGNLNGTSTVTGPTNASYNGLSVPCTASFTVVDTAGSGKVTAASFSGSSTCLNITACNLPWPLGLPVTPPPPPFDGEPLAASGVANNTRINNVCVHIPAPINQTCMGTVNGTLTNPSPNTFTFTGTLAASPGPGSCTVNSRGSLTPSPALGIQP